MDSEYQKEMKSIRLYKTGSRLIIEIDGADESFDQTVLSFLSGLLKGTVHVDSLDVEPVVKRNTMPSRTEYMDTLLLTEGPYAGYSAKQALHRDGEVALVRLYEYAKAVRDSEEKEAICMACKHYMATALKEREAMIAGEEEIVAFIRTIAPLIDVQKMLHMFTYQDLEEFLETADYEEKRLAFEGIIESLIQRGMQ